LPSTSPVILANATDVTAGGERAVFSNEYFLNTLGSSLVDIRIATAVATSAAFPGVFDSVTFQRFRSANIFEPRGGTSPLQPPSSVHLIDGGASDNLGAGTLWDAALTELYGNTLTSMPDKLAGKPCVIIAVDANAPNTSARFEHFADERSRTDRIFNRNIFDAIDALFEHRRQDTLIKMGLAQKEFGIFASENFGDMAENYVDRTRVDTFEVTVNCRPEFDAVRCGSVPSRFLEASSSCEAPVLSELCVAHRAG
jgi:NTE family protein